MDVCQFAGARWWKFDFHTHTPASDFRDMITPECWLKAFMKKGIDCVAITDHNSGAWIDPLKQKLEELEESKPIWYRPLHLFPGVEISASGNVHILAIFGPDKDGSCIDQLLGAVDYRGTNGDSDVVTNKSIVGVINEIAERGGIPIPAHIDKRRGLFLELEGITLKQVLRNENIYAAELRDGGYQKPQLYRDEKVQWAEVNGSDTHSFSEDTFGTFTWIKMDEPSIDGLKLALIDGTPSVNRDISVDPNQHAECFVEELGICNAKYVGRTEPLNCQFSPFLNTIIGGRGSGKSTLLEFMRLVLERDEEILEPLEGETQQYFNIGGNNLLLENSKVSLIYRKGEVRYRLTWDAEMKNTSVKEKKGGVWQSCDVEIRSLFPVYIYSQKQIFELSKSPSALIDIVDKAPEVDAGTIETQHRDLVYRYKQIEGEQRELSDKIAEEKRLRSESNDLVRQIKQIEKSGHKVVLQNYRERQQQLNELDNLEIQWKEMSERLFEVKDSIAPGHFNEKYFVGNSDFFQLLKGANEKWQIIHDELSKLAREGESILTDWHAKKNKTDWMWTLEADIERYDQLCSQLEQQGIDPGKYRQLLTQQKTKEQDLRQIDEYKLRQEELKVEGKEILEEIEENRRSLSENRQKFLNDVLQGNQFVSIKVRPFGENWNSIEKTIREILQCGDRFKRDMENLKDIYQQSTSEGIERLKEEIKSIRNEERAAIDNRFANHLKGLPQESVSNLIVWFPGDNLKVTFGHNHQEIEYGSPGQKTAALLAFILSYGNEPLLLDQPEDDLDNELIYSLIVHQLRETKSRRQVIIVTHNANIVVNGDAEMVLPLKAAGGETHIRQTASIQEKEVRDAICDILEGGQQAFEQRYKRIHLGD